MRLQAVSFLAFLCATKYAISLNRLEEDDEWSGNEIVSEGSGDEYARPMPDSHSDDNDDDYDDQEINYNRQESYEGSGNEDEEQHQRRSSSRRRSSGHWGCDRCPATIDNVNLHHLLPRQWSSSATYTQFVQIGDFIANDGCGHYDHSCRAIKINSDPFTIWVPPSQINSLDHLKYVLLSDQSYILPDHGSAEFRFKVSAEVFGVDKSYFPPAMIQENDYRFASGMVGVTDNDNNLSFGFILTNDRVYAYYQRLPYARSERNNYAAFVNVIPLVERNCDQVMELNVRLDATRHEVIFEVDGCEKYQICRVGYPAERRLMVADFGGNPEMVWSKSVQYFLGTITMLDYYPAAKNPDCRKDETPDCECGFPQVLIGLVNCSNEQAPELFDPSSYTQYPANYYDAVGEEECMHIWGQGVKMSIESIVVETRTCNRSNSTWRG